MKKRKLFTIFGLFLATMLLFAGCGAPAEKEVVLIEHDGLSTYEIFLQKTTFISNRKSNGSTICSTVRWSASTTPSSKKSSSGTAASRTILRIMKSY